MPPKHADDRPSDEVTGQSALPMSRVKKIIQLDEDVLQYQAYQQAKNTELFIRYLAEQGHNVVKSERKPRKTIQYKDLATAVSRIDNLEFLSDVIPKTTTYKQFKESRAKEATKPDTTREKGQRTLNGTIPLHSKVNGDSTEPEKAGNGSHAPTSLSALIDDQAAGNPSATTDEDVEMTD